MCAKQIEVYAITKMLVICRVKKTKSRTVWSGTCHGLRGARSSSVWREKNKWVEELKHTKTWTENEFEDNNSIENHQLSQLCTQSKKRGSSVWLYPELKEKAYNTTGKVAYYFECVWTSFSSSWISAIPSPVSPVGSPPSSLRLGLPVWLTRTSCRASV